MTTHFDTDPNTETVAAAWASSPLGQLEHDDSFAVYTAPVAPPADRAADRRRPVGKHAFVACVLAGGIAAGAALGLVFADFTPDQPTVAIPATTSPQPAVVVNPSPRTPPPIDAGRDAATAPVVLPAPSTATVDTPAAVPAPPAPEAPASEVPEPQPPRVPDLDFTLPDAQPDPTPPVFQPDLPKAPMPEPKPEPKPAPPSMPDFDISAGPGS